MSKPHIDELDRAIIAKLHTDARIANNEVAEALGVSEGAIRERIRRLERDGLLRFTVMTRTAPLTGREMTVFITLQVDLDRVYAVAERIKAIACVNSCVTTLGRFNIAAMGHFQDLEHMRRVVGRQIAVLPGVRHVETAVELKAVKVNYQFGRIIRELPPPDESRVDQNAD